MADLQRSENWFAMRAGKFTGSRFADLMATNSNGRPSASRDNLLAQLVAERMTGRCIEGYSNAAMRRGTALEPEARGAYEIWSGEFVDQVMFVHHPDLPYVGVSPDGLVGADGLVEIKCPDSMAKHLAALRGPAVAEEYAWQIQGQLWVTGRKWCDAVSYDPRWEPAEQIAVTRVARNETAIARLDLACRRGEIEVRAIINELKDRRNAA